MPNTVHIRMFKSDKKLLEAEKKKLEKELGPNCKVKVSDPFVLNILLKRIKRKSKQRLQYEDILRL